MGSKVWFYWGTLGDIVEPTSELSPPEREGTGVFIHQLPSVTSGGVLRGNWEVLTLKHLNLVCMGMVSAGGDGQCTGSITFFTFMPLFSLPSLFLVSPNGPLIIGQCHLLQEAFLIFVQNWWLLCHPQSQHSYYKILMFLPSGFAFTQLIVKDRIDDWLGRLGRLVETLTLLLWFPS